MPSKRTFLAINNHTASPFLIRVRDVDSFDWDDKVGPLKFNDRLLHPGNKVEERLEINSWASANLYTLLVCFDEETILCFRIDQGIAAGRTTSYSEYIPPGVTCLVAKKPQALLGLELATATADFIHACFAHKERGIFKVTGNAPVRVDHRIEGETLVIDVKPM